MRPINDSVRAVKASARALLDSPAWCHVFLDPGNVDLRVLVADLGPVTRRVRGRFMRTDDGFDEEFSAAWQLDDYDGPSSGAYLRDCLSDMYLRWPTDQGFVTLVTQPEQILIDEPGEKERYSPLRGLVDTFAEAASRHSQPSRRPPTDPLARGVLSFDVVLVTDSEHRDEVVRRWKAAGAPLDG